MCLSYASSGLISGWSITLIPFSRVPSPSQAQREEAATARARLRAEMDEALAAQQRRAEAWQAELDAKETRLTTLDAKLKALPVQRLTRDKTAE